MHKLLNQFTSSLVRDLAWVIASPPLVSGIHNDTYWWDQKMCLNEFKDCLPELVHLDKKPEALIKHLEKLTSRRLGFRFEALVAYWLKISPNYQLLSKNLQIIEEGITLGEIDFIIQDLKSQKIIHLEVAVKFYLGSPPYENPYRWFGTNTKDQLGRKLDHLKQHQTQLCKKYRKHFNHEIDEQHCLIKGRLFYPEKVETSPEGVASNHLRGLWLYSKGINADFLIPIAKIDWLADLSHVEISHRINNPKVQQGSRAQCFANITKNDAGEYQEKMRVFCLPADFSFPD